MWTRRELKEKGSWCFRANYWKCVLVGVLVSLIAGGTGAAAGSSSIDETEAPVENMVFGPHGFYGEFYWPALFLGVGALIIVIALVVAIFVFNPLYVGSQAFFVKNLNMKADISEVGRGFDRNYKNVVYVMFKYNLFLFLWSLLFVIPGIYKAYEYRMIPYLLAENPNMPEQEAFQRSRDMMNGQKWNAFVLDLSFIGWHILGILTFGILEVFYIAPYQEMTNAALYERLMYGTPAGSYDNDGYNGNSYNSGYSNGGYNGGYNNGGYNGNGYNGGYNNGGYNGNGYNGGYNNGSWNNGGYDGNGYNDGWNNGGYNGNGYNGGYGNGGYNGNGYNGGYNNGGYHGNGYNSGYHGGYSNGGYNGDFNNGGHDSENTGSTSTSSESAGNASTGSADTGNGSSAQENKSDS